jgi:hypothetical protein
MENPPMLFMGKSTISLAIFNSYFDITRGYGNPQKNQMLSGTTTCSD